MEGCERCEWWSKQGLSPRCPYHDGLWADEQIGKRKRKPLAEKVKEACRQPVTES
jgi:hypothetical protein